MQAIGKSQGILAGNGGWGTRRTLLALAAAMLTAVAAVATLGGCASSPAGTHAGQPQTAASDAVPTGTAAASSAPSASVSSAPPASAWLAPSEIPFSTTFSWSLFTGSANRGVPIGQPEGNGVYYVSADTTFQAISSCGDPSLILSQPLGARQRQFVPTSGASQDLAGQWISSYADAAAGQAAWQRLQAVYQGCLAAEAMPQITLTETAQSQDAMAWFHSNHGALPDLAPYVHEYFVLSKNEIAYVYVQGGGAALAMTPDDAQVLATISGHLNGG